ncbi:glycosyltransferase family 8 protein [Mycena rebaudengoi]|nr:glycosyltransferase family 8 protein [Mycena rebaudengoi]
MPLPTFRRYVKSWRYERLPPDYRDSAPPKSGKVLALRIGVVVAFCAATIYVVTRIFLSLGPRAYNPLDDYQNINPFETTVHTHIQSPPSRRAVVSSLYSDGYAIAVAVLGHSVRSANTFTPRFKDLYTKLNIWALDKKGIDSAVFLDADTLVRRNFDELFDSPFGFAAVPDVYSAGDAHGFRLTLNTGVMAFTPSSRVLESMRAALEVAVFPLGEADQAFLNLYFGGTCIRLPYIYNANLAIKARSPTLWARLKDEIRIVHYTLLKPFLHDANDSTDSVLALEEMERIMAQEAARYGGVYAEEFRWWKEAYEDMLDVKGHEIRVCFKLQ